MAAQNFLQTMLWLKGFFLQDHAFLQDLYTNLPFFNHRLFKHPQLAIFKSALKESCEEAEKNWVDLKAAEANVPATVGRIEKSIDLMWLATKQTGIAFDYFGEVQAIIKDDVEKIKEEVSIMHKTVTEMWTFIGGMGKQLDYLCSIASNNGNTSFVPESFTHRDRNANPEERCDNNAGENANVHVDVDSERVTPEMGNKNQAQSEITENEDISLIRRIRTEMPLCNRCMEGLQ